MRIGNDIGERDQCHYLSSLFPYCIQNDVTSLHLSWDVGLKKPRPILLGVGKNKILSFVDFFLVPVHSNMADLARQMFRDCTYDLKDIQLCRDCYRYSCDKNDKFWFCKPCRPFHELVIIFALFSVITPGPSLIHRVRYASGSDRPT